MIACIWANKHASYTCKNWFYNVKLELRKCNLSHFSNLDNQIPKRQILDLADKFLTDKFVFDWRQCISNPDDSSFWLKKAVLYLLT